MSKKISQFFLPSGSKRAPTPMEESGESEPESEPTAMETGPDFGTAHERDFGRVVGQMHLTDEEKHEWLTNYWKPPQDYPFPQVVERTKRRALSMAILDRHPFIAFSPALGGLFCRACVLFGSDVAGKSKREMKNVKFVDLPFNDWGHIEGPAQKLKDQKGITRHESTEYHKNAAHLAYNFQQSFTGKTASIAVLLNEQHDRFLRHIRHALKERFGSLFENVARIQGLFPWKCNETKFGDLKPTLDFYRESALRFSDEEFKVQFETWQLYCSDYKGEHTLDAAIDFCNKAHVAIIFDLLKIFAITPVTTDIAERSFSSLKLLKTYLRNRTKEERLSSLALAYVNQDVLIENSDVTDIFIQKNRRIDFGAPKDDENIDFTNDIEL